MKTGVAVTFDDLSRALRSLAHDLADQAEAGYLARPLRSADLHLADGLEERPSGGRGESHDGAGG